MKTPPPDPADNRPCEATPGEELMRQIMDPNIGKNEREWFAKRTIEELKRQLDAAQKDTLRLEWLIRNGYAPAKWRPATKMEIHCGRHRANGMFLVAPASRETIDDAMNKK